MKRFFYSAIVCFVVIFLNNTLKAQTTEIFETETAGSTIFTDNGQSFTITSQANGPFNIYDSGGSNYGWNGTAPDTRFIDNTESPTAPIAIPVQFTISSGAPFIVNQFWLFLSNTSVNLAVSGSVTITGKLGGATIYTATQSTGFTTSLGVNNGFSLIDLSVFGSQNNDNKPIDELIISTGGSYQYVALDAFDWTKTAPEINVQGNSTTIADGDATPGAADHTDFGSQSICSGTIVRTFTIQNTGNGNLTISSVNITGSASSDYTVTAAPASTIAAAGSTTFQVTFNPSATGARNATVTINNNDANEAAYDFAITGTGIDPEMNVQGNSTTIADGDVTPGLTDHSDFGSQSVCSGTIVRTFTIQNTGTSNLNLSSVNITGVASADYSVTTSPASAVAAAGSTTFQVTFNPSATGARNATITVNSNDCDEAAYDFAITGTGIDPEMNVQGNSITITDGDVTPGAADHTDFGSQSVCSGTIVRTFTIQNTGTNNLNLSSVNITGVASADYSVTTSPAPTIAAAGSTTFQVTFNPSAAGARNATITINNNDCDEATYDFAITGTGTDPEMNVQGNSTTIADGDATPSTTDHTDFGSQNICSGAIIRTFTIQNTGTSNLTISAVNITGIAAADYSVTTSPAPAVAAAGSTTFQVTFNPSATGARNATITVNNNDCDEAAYDFAITGTGTDPEVNVQGNSTNIADGDATPGAADHTDFGSQASCSGTIIRTFTIQNAGTSDLTISSVNITGTAASDYSISSAPATTIAAAGSTTFQVTFNPSVTGARNATITVNNDDCDEATYDFAITGTGIDPEMNVQGNGTTIADGDVTPGLTDHSDFGSQSVCSGTIIRTFTIQNTGNNILNISSINITGAGAADYSVTTGPSSTIAPGGSTTFQVTFNPSVIGIQNATITVTNDDCDESLYDFAITGTGSADLNSPIISNCPLNISISSNNSGCTGAVTWTAPTAVDDCGTVNVNSTHNSGDVFPLGITSVTYTFDDGNGNSSACTFDVEIINDMQLSDNITGVECNGDTTGSIDLTVTGGTPGYTFDWNSGSFTSEDIINEIAGNYAVTVTDGNGCTATSSYTITEPSAITITVDNFSSPTSCIIDDGTADITVAGGTGSYDYEWSNGAYISLVEDPIDLPAGTSTITVTDDNNCTSSETILLTSPNAPAIFLNSSSDTLLSCFGDNNGIINIDVILSPSATSASFDWNSGTYTTEDISGLEAGTYLVVATDNDGCSSSAPYQVVSPDSISLSYTSIDAGCFGTLTGSINLTATGGTIASNYDFSWNQGSITEDLINITAGTYFVTVTDDNGCTATTPNIIINEDPAIDVNVSTTIFTMTANNNSPGTTYQWYNCTSNTPISGQTNQSYLPDVDGEYAVIITQDGCTDTSACITIIGLGIEDNNKEQQILIYPNPSDGNFSILSSTVSQFTITDMMGRVIYSGETSIGEMKYQLNYLLSGVYQLVYNISEKSYTKKIIITK